MTVRHKAIAVLIAVGLIGCCAGSTLTMLVDILFWPHHEPGRPVVLLDEVDTLIGFGIATLIVAVVRWTRRRARGGER